LHNQEKKNELAVKNVIEGFGNSLKNVSLLAPPAILNQDLDKNYKDFLSPALLEEWKKTLLKPWAVLLLALGQTE